MTNEDFGPLEVLKAQALNLWVGERRMLYEIEATKASGSLAAPPMFRSPYAQGRETFELSHIGLNQLGVFNLVLNQAADACRARLEYHCAMLAKNYGVERAELDALYQRAVVAHFEGVGDARDTPADDPHNGA